MVGRNLLDFRKSSPAINLRFICRKDEPNSLLVFRKLNTSDVVRAPAFNLYSGYINQNERYLYTVELIYGPFPRRVIRESIQIKS